MGEIQCRLRPDDDGMGVLSVEASAGGFAGSGSCWFRLAELDDFASRLAEAFPIEDSTALELKGGYHGPGASTGLEQVLVRLRFYPVGSHGRVGVRIELQDPWGPELRRDSLRRVETELLTSYRMVGRFATELAELVAGRREVARLGTDEET